MVGNNSNANFYSDADSSTNIGSVLCEEKSSLPNITFQVGTSDKYQAIVFTPEEYVIDDDEGDSEWCSIGILTDSTNDYWTFGKLFLTYYYTIFDITDSMIGIAKSIEQQ